MIDGFSLSKGKTFLLTYTPNLESIFSLSFPIKYESKTTVKMTHSEGGEISSFINDFSAEIRVDSFGNTCKIRTFCPRITDKISSKRSGYSSGLMTRLKN